MLYSLMCRSKKLKKLSQSQKKKYTLYSSVSIQILTSKMGSKNAMKKGTKNGPKNAMKQAARPKREKVVKVKGTAKKSAKKKKAAEEDEGIDLENLLEEAVVGGEQKDAYQHKFIEREKDPVLLPLVKVLCEGMFDEETQLNLSTLLHEVSLVELRFREEKDFLIFADIRQHERFALSYICDRVKKLTEKELRKLRLEEKKFLVEKILGKKYFDGICLDNQYEKSIVGINKGIERINYGFKYLIGNGALRINQKDDIERVLWGSLKSFNLFKIEQAFTQTISLFNLSGDFVFHFNTNYFTCLSWKSEGKDQQRFGQFGQQRFGQFGQQRVGQQREVARERREHAPLQQRKET